MDAEMLKTRTKKFAIEVAKYCEGLPSRIAIVIYSKQLIYSQKNLSNLIYLRSTSVVNDIPLDYVQLFTSRF